MIVNCNSKGAVFFVTDYKNVKKFVVGKKSEIRNQKFYEKNM